MFSKTNLKKLKSADGIFFTIKCLVKRILKRKILLIYQKHKSPLKLHNITIWVSVPTITILSLVSLNNKSSHFLMKNVNNKPKERLEPLITFLKVRNWVDFKWVRLVKNLLNEESRKEFIEKLNTLWNKNTNRNTTQKNTSLNKSRKRKTIMKKLATLWYLHYCECLNF